MAGVSSAGADEAGPVIGEEEKRDEVDFEMVGVV